MDKYIGKRLEGRYEIQELIGMGGMSNVYKAFDAIDDRIVAVKILREEFLDNAEFLRMFKNESKAIAVLSHPNIVRVYDVSFTNSVHSIVMEYIDGITMKDYIERQGMLSWKEAVHFTLQILRALQHAHDKGIVHRDIKPHNIMLLQNGSIKVTDFGIARFARSEVKTITDRAIGSVHYISPEQAMGGDTDEKSDIYSVGVMLFEMLTGRLPFEADTAVSVAIKQIQTPAARPRSLNPEIPEGLEEITMRAMQKDAGRRYQSAADMIVDIEKFKQDPSISFAYKYLDGESENLKNKKYRKAVNEKRGRESEPEDDGERIPVKRKSKTPYIPILTGVTLAFVLAAFSFIGLMVYYNNPFKQVDEIPVPDLVGMKFDTVTAQFDDFEIIAEETNYNDEWNKDVIYEQKPKAGTSIKIGSPVRVMVSLGQRIVTLANFSGKDASQSFSKIKELGLDYKETRIYSDDVPTGCVIYTDPSKDTELASGSVVTVYVSMGPEMQLSDVPSLIGLRADDASKLLELYKLRLGNTTEEVSAEPSGTIIAQDPSPQDGLQPQGTAVNIVVSKEGVKHLTIPIPLPALNESLTIRARDADSNEILANETINPVADEVNVWKPVFTGSEADSEPLNIKIFINGKVYMEYMLDFKNESHTQTRDRSAAAEFQPGGRD